MIPRFYCAPAPKKKSFRQKKKSLTLVVFEFNTCLTNVQTDLHLMFLILIFARWASKLRKASTFYSQTFTFYSLQYCYQPSYSIVTNQVEMRCFSKYFILLFTFFVFSKREDRIFSLRRFFKEFRCSIYCNFQVVETYGTKYSRMDQVK